MSYILRIVYCGFRIMSCLLVHEKVNNKAGKLFADLLMAGTDGDIE